MAYSKLNYTYTGTNLFAINFTLGYLDKAHVKARVNEEVDGAGDPVYRTLTWVTDGSVSLSGTLNTNDKVVITRNTPKTAVTHYYSDGEILDDENLDESFLQTIMIAHEALDGRLGVFQENLDMGAFKIVSLSDAENDADAVNLAQMTSAIAAASGLGGAIPATQITFNNTSSGLAATQVQDAIDEVEDRLDTAETSISTNATNISTNSTNITTNATDIDTLEAYNATHGDIVTTNIADYATAAQGALADTAVQPADIAGFMEYTEGTEQDTSTGSAWNWDSIPSDAKLIALHLKGNSQSSNGNWLIQFKVSGTVVTSGYESTSSNSSGTTVNATTGFIIRGAGSTITFNGGIIWLSRESSSSNTWTVQGGVGRSDSTDEANCRGAVSLAGAPDGLRLTTTTGDGDAGVANITVYS